jgi:hypothetical protein
MEHIEITKVKVKIIIIIIIIIVIIKSYTSAYQGQGNLYRLIILRNIIYFYSEN